MSESDFQASVSSAKARGIRLLDRLMIIASVDGQILREAVLDIINEEFPRLENSSDTPEARRLLSAIIAELEQIEEITDV